MLIRNFFKNKFSLVGILIFSALSAKANYIYERTWNAIGQNYIRSLSKLPTDNLNALDPQQRQACSTRYNPILSDGLIDIRIPIGYFDWTTGSEVIHNGNNYGISPSMDHGIFVSLVNRLVERCRGNTSFCGFSQVPGNPYAFHKQLVVHGKRVLARIQINFPSASEFYYKNTGPLLSQQQNRSAYMTDFFLRGLREADAVFYFGHSRNGGGPDFNPPIFYEGTNKVNYTGYYEKYRPGEKRMLQSLAQNRSLPILGLMSCTSRNHFLRNVRKVAPQTGVITSLDVLNANIVYTALIGGVDALLRGQCQKSFYQSLRLTDDNRKYMTMDGMFEL